MKNVPSILDTHSVMWVAGLCLAMAPHAVQAQGSVTLYGVLDAAVERVSNVGAARGTVVRMASITGTLPSRFGLRGREDLGNGMAAVFVLESGFAVDQGSSNQSGRLFGRQAYVGLQGGWGQLSFGRQYSQIFYSVIGDQLGPQAYAGVLDSYLPNARVDNALAYRGTFGDWTVGTTYSLGRDAVASAPAGGCAGESATDAKSCRALSGMAQYATKQWGLATAWERQWGGAGAGSAIPLSSQRDTRKVVSGFYKFDNLTLGTGYLWRDNEGAAKPKTGLWFVGGSYMFNHISLALETGKVQTKSSANASSTVVGRVMYHFSKRTATYFTMGRLLNQGEAKMSIDGGVPTGSDPLPGTAQNGIMVGLRHSF